MTMNLTRAITRLSLSVILFAGVGFAADPTEVENFLALVAEAGAGEEWLLREEIGELLRPSATPPACGSERSPAPG